MKNGILKFVLFAFVTQPLIIRAINIDDVEYSLSGKEATIINTESVNRDSLIIPEIITYEGLHYTVTKVKRFAFGALDSYRYVKLPKSIIELENCAFACNWDGEDNRPLSTVDLSACNQLRSISDSCFISKSFWGSWDSRRSLENVYLPNSITEIGFRAFYHCYNIKEISLPTQLKQIGREAFAYTKLKCVLIPKDVINIDIEAFNNCNLLRTIIYLPVKAPENWIATSDTYVPDKESYSSPKSSINNAQIIEMITFNQTEFEYSGQTPSTTWTNNIEGYTASLDMPTLNADAGTHTVNITTTFSDGEHTFIAQIPCRYTVKPIKLNAKVSNVSRSYGEENPSFSITYSGFLSGDNESVITTNPTVATTATKESNVGEYPITISGGIAANYEFIYEPGVLTVTKAQLSAKVNDITKVYGAQNPTFTIDYYGLKNGEDAPAWATRPSFQTDATHASGVGCYTVKAINGVPVNYDLGEITSGILSIIPASLAIKVNDAVRQYYSDDPTFSYSCNGFVNGDDERMLTPTPTLTTTATRSSNVGTYEIKVGETSSPNYSISYINGTLTVTPRTLVASVGNYERLYNEENPAFEVKYDGFAGNDSENNLSLKPTANTAATSTSNVGTYPINVSGGDATNYKFTYVSGVLTINKAEQTIEWNQDLSNIQVGSQVELNAVASSGLPIEYTMESNNSASLYKVGTKTYIDCIAAGHFLMRASQDGNNNYYGTPRVTNAINIVGNTIADPTLTIIQGEKGLIRTQVPKGSIYTFSFEANDGWRVHSVSFNDEDITEQLDANNRFTTPNINTSTTLNVVYESSSDGITSARVSSAKIIGTSFGIKVENARPNEVLQVYTIDGKLVKKQKLQSSEVDVQLPNNETYIINLEDLRVKVRL